ncbi:MAG: coiled-coil domain-containing protein [Candidatus Nanopelagicales bacterium]
MSLRRRRTLVAGVSTFALGVALAVAPGEANAEPTTPPSPSASATAPSASSVGSWMAQPESAALLKEMQSAQAEFEQAHRKQVRAQRTVEALSRKIAAQRRATNAATLRIERYARSAYMTSADPANLGALANVLEAGGAQGLAQGTQLLRSVAGIQARDLQQALDVLGGVEVLRAKQRRIQGEAQRVAQRAKDHGQEVLNKLSALLGPTPEIGQRSTTPTTCPTKAPAGSLMDGSAAIGVKALCQRSVKQARSPAAAAAIVWAFNHLGKPYTHAGVPIDNENFGSFNCATFVAQAFYWGAHVAGFMALPWTPAYVTPPPFIKPIGNDHQSGDINIMWKGGSLADSGGQAGHAQLLIADGWLIQSGGTGGATNVARYPNGWPGWQETHFALALP